MTWDFQTIYTLAMSIMPTIINILMLIVGFKKLLKETKGIETYKNQMTMIIKENCELKAKINEILTAIDHVERKD